ncbi:MAG: ABC transporter permease subunit [Anaerolineaceae bacterium]|nr:ABC transporter permease subunit [Anaerolineaceae bacterium]
MNTRAMWAIIRKDLKVVLQSKSVLIPLIMVPLILLVLMPGVGGLLLANADADSEMITDFRREAGAFFDNLPDTFSTRLDQYDNEVQRITYILFNMFFPSLYLILPVMAANVIAADSFAGEKERKTLEALLYAPTTDRELYLAKIVGPWVAGIAIGWLGYIAFALVVTATTFSYMGEAFIIDGTWLLLIIWIVPAAAGLGLGAMVWVSSRVSTFQEAYQLGGMIVIPLILLILGQVGGVVYFSPLIVLIIGAVLWVPTIILIWYGARSFKRGELIARL